MSETSAALTRSGTNYSLKDDIRAYWTKRAETFDLSWGHKIRTDSELEAWCGIIADHGAHRTGDRALELASGTGEVTRALIRMGCTVDAIDLCDTMIERAKSKHIGSAVRFHLGDAENTMMPDDTYDLVVTRHLVWTLTDPASALSDWLRMLKPGRRVVIIDGDWVNASWRARVLKRLSAWLDRWKGQPALWDQAAHQNIMDRLPYGKGLSLEAVTTLLRRAGFVDIRSGDLSVIRRHQWRSASWSERLRMLATYDGNTFVVSAAKPSA